MLKIINLFYLTYSRLFFIPIFCSRQTSHASLTTNFTSSRFQKTTTNTFKRKRHVVFISTATIPKFNAQKSKVAIYSIFTSFCFSFLKIWQFTEFSEFPLLEVASLSLSLCKTFSLRAGFSPPSQLRRRISAWLRVAIWLVRHRTPHSLLSEPSPSPTRSSRWSRFFVSTNLCLVAEKKEKKKE